MQKLNLPCYEFKIIEDDNNKLQILDELRRKYVRLTPEEWVRQNFIKYLIEEKKFPKGLIAIEMALDISRNKNRCDVVCFNKECEAVLIIECKAPKVKITKDVFDQAARYNMKLKTRYTIMTNGLQHYCCKINYEKCEVEYLKENPLFMDL